MKKINPDTKERIRVFFLFALEAYKISMGTMLAIFVPHTCDELSEGNDECSILDSFVPTTTYGMVTLSVNGLTMLAICMLYTVELMRENFFIERLDIDPNFPDNHLKDISDDNLKALVLKWNHRYWRAAVAAMCLVTSNIVLSIIYISRHYGGTSTVTTILSFSLLVMMKLYRSFQMARKDRSEMRARSAYMTEYSSFNTIDTDYMIELEI